jgi:hypothetical protein
MSGASTRPSIHWQESEYHMDHDKILLEQSLAKQRSEIKQRFNHEINEALICLSGEQPNIEMAVDRLKQMQEFLNRLTSRQ